ncbi:MAG: copper resistance system multicopper oxidase [Candidatus Sericytochromatia bacterium]
MDTGAISRRELLQRAGQLGLLALTRRLLPAYAWGAGLIAEARPAQEEASDLTIRQLPVAFGGRREMAFSINGTIPGPVIRLKEGQEAVIRVHNQLEEVTSIHWHGILLPPQMDGVPGVSFGGIAPGQTFVYRFPVRQAGTYWYHSHSGGQEQMGVYAPLIIDPIAPEPFRYDRDYVIMLSEWPDEDPMVLLGKLKAQADYFNYQQRTVGDFFADAAREGWGEAIADRLMWGRMRMNPTDLADLTGASYTYLLNGRPAADGWTGRFSPGERVRLRIIDGGAMTFFDLRIPGLEMTVVQVDGQNVRPVAVDELRIGPGETYDVIVEPKGDRAYTVFAETLDRSGYALGTLAPREGMRGPVPERRRRAVRSMADMGMDHAGGHGDHAAPAGAHAGHDAAAGMPAIAAGPVPHGPDHRGPGNSMVAATSRSRLDEPGIGLGEDGWRVLVYTDLVSLEPWQDLPAPTREVEIHLTGNMERFMWSIDGQKFSEAPGPIVFRQGETLRLTMINDTMMEHPMHLHGMWMYLENGHGKSIPRKHTLIVKPAERVSVAIEVDAPVGPWAFHCHLLLHMEMGMFRVVEVVRP